MEAPTEQQFFDQADVVFGGVAVSSRDPNAGAAVVSSADPIIYTFAADRVLKGSITTQPVVSTARSGASCGTAFTLGVRYRVYARGVPGSLTTDSGSGNRLVPLSASATTVPVPRPTRPSLAPPASPASGAVSLTG